jgi:glyoxylase-like metal-dependent hydrolase (beta-lactamase superfamily II)
MVRLSAAIVCACSVACTTSLQVPRSFTPNVERDTLEQLVALPDPPEEAVVFLVGEYLADHRLHEGRDYFRARAAQHSDSPLFEALEAFFAVQLAPEVPLLSRADYVDAQLARLDRAAGRAPHSAARLFRAFVLARLPERFHRAAQAVGELELLASPEAKLPLVVMHDVHLALANAYAAVGRGDEARRALARSGYAALDGGPAPLTTAISVSPRDGTRYEAESFVEAVPGVWAAYGYDYGDFFFVVGDGGVIAIDAGAVPERVARAKQQLRAHTLLPITHVILTHAHWDHAGGLSALVEPGTQIIASARYRETIANMAPFDLDRERSFLGLGGATPGDLRVDRPIDAPTTLVANGIQLQLLPVAGAETADCLLVELPARHVVFTGDLIADLGIPFLAEGSTRGFIDNLRRLAAYPDGTRLLHGHQPVGELLPASKLVGLARAFAELRELVLADIHAGLGAADVLRKRGIVPALHAHPELAVPFLIFREAFVQRVFRETTGPWAMDGEGMEPATRGELGAALDLVAEHDPDRIARATESLVLRGDFGLAWRIAELGLTVHPDDPRLVAARRHALHGLLARNERWDFFKLTVYSQMSNTPIPPPR